MHQALRRRIRTCVGAAVAVLTIAMGSAGAGVAQPFESKRSAHIYVADATPSAGKILVFGAQANGNVPPERTIAGAATQVVIPRAEAVDAKGDLFVADDGHGFPEVLVFRPKANGNVRPAHIIAGPATTFQDIEGMALDADGDIYVADMSAQQIDIFAPNAKGDVKPKAILGGSNTKLVGPKSITIDSSGNLFALTTLGNIYEFAPGATGNVAPIASLNPGFLQSQSVSAGAQTLYVGFAIDSQHPGQVLRFDLPSLTQGPTLNWPNLSSLLSATADAGGTVYVANIGSPSSVAVFLPGTHTPRNVIAGVQTLLDNFLTQSVPGP